MQLKASTVIALEGPDDTGKSTLWRYLREKCEDPEKPLLGEREPLFTHQPSGAPGLGYRIYQMTETDEMQPLTRQLLHLAAHTQHWADELEPALEAGRSVVLDRCWWSAYAYGMSMGLHNYMSTKRYRGLCQAPMLHREIDLVFLFMDPFRSNKWNTETLFQRYWELAELHSDRVVVMPVSSVTDRAVAFCQALDQFGLLEP